MSVNILFVATLLTHLMLVGSAYSCERYKDLPTLMNAEEFMKLPGIGTIALKPYPNRSLFLPFTETGCYDLTEKYSFLPPHEFFLDSSGEQDEITYISASVARHFPYQMKNVPASSLELFRNESKDDVAASWAKALRNEDKFLDGSAIPGGEFAVFDREYETQKPIDIGDLEVSSELDLIGAPKDASYWHALIIDVQGIPNMNTVYRVLRNTRRAADYLSKGLVKAKGNVTVLNKLYLVKFRSVPGQLLREPVLEVGPSGCLYVSYQIGGSDSIPIKVDGKFDNLVFRFDKKSDC